MGFFGDLTYTDRRPQFVGSPVDDIKALNQNLADKYYTNQAAYDSLEAMANNVNVLNQDVEYKKAAIDRLSNGISGMVANGNWEDANNIVRGLAKEFSNDKNLKSAIEQQQFYQNWLAEQQTRANEGNITQQRLQESASIALDRYRGVKVDPTTGVVTGGISNFLRTSPDYIDIYDRFDERIKNWKPNQVIGNIVKTGTGYFRAGTTEQVSMQEVYNALSQELTNDPKIQEFLADERYYEDINRFGRDRTTGQVNTDDTGTIQYRGIDITDLQSLGFNIDNQGNITYPGIDNQGNPIDSPVANINELSQEQIASLYDNSRNQQIVDSYVNPAATKASYIKEEPKFLMDWRAKLALDDTYKRSRMNFKKGLDTPRTVFRSQNAVALDNQNVLGKALLGADLKGSFYNGNLITDIREDDGMRYFLDENGEIVSLSTKNKDGTYTSDIEYDAFGQPISFGDYTTNPEWKKMQGTLYTVVGQMRSNFPQATKGLNDQAVWEMYNNNIEDFGSAVIPVVFGKESNAFDLDNSADYIHGRSLSNATTIYVDGKKYTGDKKQDILDDIYNDDLNKGYSQPFSVNLMNEDGVTLIGNLPSGHIVETVPNEDVRQHYEPVRKLYQNMINKPIGGGDLEVNTRLGTFVIRDTDDGRKIYDAYGETTLGILIRAADNDAFNNGLYGEIKQRKE